LRAFDQAGNRSASTRAVLVRVRYIEFRKQRVRALAGRRFSIRVSTDARAYRWLLNRRRGIAHKKVLVLRAPADAGTYALYVRVGKHADRAVVLVAKPK
jgi:hypothetical protein